MRQLPRAGDRQEAFPKGKGDFNPLCVHMGLPDTPHILKLLEPISFQASLEKG